MKSKTNSRGADEQPIYSAARTWNCSVQLLLTKWGYKITPWLKSGRKNVSISYQNV